MLKVLATATALLSLVAAGCTGDDATQDWTAACIDLEAAPPLSAAGSYAFAADRRAGSELVVADADSRKTRRLTRQRSPHDNIGDIAWSPDGTQIAYSGGTSGWSDGAYDDLWIVSVDGGRPLRLTDSYEDDWHPVWSPDGTMLAFDRQDDGYNWIYVINVDGTGLRRLTRNFNWNPAWTPDGRISYVNSAGIWVMNSDGSEKRLLARADVRITGYASAAPIWSPDGTHIAFTKDTSLWVMKADGTGRRKIFGDALRTTRSPTWSPDSDRIAWTQGDGDLEIYVAHRDGSGLLEITDNAGVVDEAPVWSPDGSSIVFIRTCRSPKRQLRTVLLVVDADGGEPRKLSGGLSSYPVWAP